MVCKSFDDSNTIMIKMTPKIVHIIEPLILASGKMTKEEVDAITSAFPFKFPASYTRLAELINGYEGEIGDHSWLCLFPVAELAEVNDNYRLLMDQIPDHFLIGKDAADTGYAFHKYLGTFHSFGLMSDFRTDPIDFMGNDFYEFLEKLYV